MQQHPPRRLHRPPFQNLRDAYPRRLCAVPVADAAVRVVRRRCGREMFVRCICSSYLQLQFLTDLAVLLVADSPHPQCLYLPIDGDDPSHRAYSPQRKVARRGRTAHNRTNPTPLHSTAVGRRYRRHHCRPQEQPHDVGGDAACRRQPFCAVPKKAGDERSRLLGMLMSAPRVFVGAFVQIFSRLVL